VPHFAPVTALTVMSWEALRRSSPEEVMYGDLYIDPGRRR
jgi:hypothetical protein